MFFFLMLVGGINFFWVFRLSASLFQQRGDFSPSGYKLIDRGFLLDCAFNSLSLVGFKKCFLLFACFFISFLF